MLPIHQSHAVAKAASVESLSGIPHSESNATRNYLTDSTHLDHPCSNVVSEELLPVHQCIVWVLQLYEDEVSSSGDACKLCLIHTPSITARRLKSWV